MVFKGHPTIGVFTKELPSFHFLPVLKGINTACDNRKLNMRVFLAGKLDSFYSLEDRLIYEMVDKESVDGIIILPYQAPLFLSKEDLTVFARRFSSIPLVNVGVALDGIPSITVENEKGSYDLVSHLIEHHGFKNIAYVGGPLQSPEAVSRLEGYKKALADHDLYFNQAFFFEGQFNVDSGINACRAFFERRKIKADVIVSANDNMMIGVYAYCKQKGINIPSDIAVAGFDNVVISSYSIPPLTTVSQPLYSLGKTAVSLVCDQLEHKSVPDLTVLPANLIIRRSCRCSYVNEVNNGIREVSETAPALSGREYQKIKEARKEVFSFIRDTVYIENPWKLQALGDYIVTIISGHSEGKCPLYQLDDVEKFIFDSHLSEYELNGWQDYLARFYCEIKKTPEFDLIKERVINIFSTIIYHVAQANRLEIVNKRRHLIKDSYRYRFAVNKISSTFVLSEFLDKVTGQFLKNNFTFFYLCLFDGNETGIPAGQVGPEKKLRLAAGYKGKVILKDEAKKRLFNADEFVPRELLESEESHRVMIFPLVQYDYNFGYLILSFQEEKVIFYNPLWEQICTSLNVIRLFEEAGKKQIALNELNVSLESKVEERTAALVAANEKLKEIDRLKTNFFANVSHELRTPLTMIMGPLESIYAGDYGETVSRRNTVFKSALDHSARLLKLINGLLDFAKIEAGKMGVTKRKTDIGKLLGYYLSIIKSSASLKDIKVVFEKKGREVNAWIDRDLMEKAFFNLFSNAIKFTPGGGKVIITLDGKEGCFSISVEDTGIGIPDDKLDTIFDRFTQVDDGAARKYDGTGIGLAFAKEIVLLHDGTISVISEYGKGTEFIINLPYGENSTAKEADNRSLETEEFQEVPHYLLADLPQLSNSAEEIPEPAGLPGELKKVLVIDDNEDIREYLASILGTRYQVVTAENGMVGLVKAKLHIPDLIISDVMMPGMSGIELCAKLKKNEALKHIPLILLTARTDMALKLDGLKGMADDFLSKPFNSRELLTRVENLLANRELHVELAKQQNTIMSSVGYAGKIQNAILPQQEDMKLVMKDFFVLWKPRDIVGGDIYWFKKMGNNFLLAVVDCTGHGIPGAFMSMAAFDQLNTIAEFICNDNPPYILRELNRRIKTTLRQEKAAEPTELNTASDDGLDIGLCYYDNDKKKLTYAGARRSLYYVDKNQLIVVNPDQVSIGYRSSPYDYCFTGREIDLKGGEVFYLTSDGFADQMGGKGGFCFGSGSLKKQLLRIHREPMEKQLAILKEKLKEYQGGWQQVDDITILGFKL